MALAVRVGIHTGPVVVGATGDDAALIVGQRIHAAGLLMRGDAEGARESVQLYVPERHRPLIARFGQDLRAQSLIYFALSEALVGRIAEARALGDEAIEHARSVDYNTLGYTLFHCGVWLQAILRETDALRRHGAELLELAREHRPGFWKALATPFLLEAEEAERAVRAYRREFNAGLTVPQLLCRVADSYVATGRTAEATQVLTEAQELMERHGEVYWEPELSRLSGRLAAAEGAPVEAVTAFERPFGSRGSAALTCSSCGSRSTSRGCRRRKASRWRRGRCSRRSTACSATGLTWRTYRTPARRSWAWTGSGRRVLTDHAALAGAVGVLCARPNDFVSCSSVGGALPGCPRTSLNSPTLRT